MKKYASFLLALCLLLSLCACAAEDPENLFGTEATTEPEVSATPVATTIPTVPTEGPAGSLGAPEELYAYGNMQRNIPSGNFALYENKVLFFVKDNLKSGPMLCEYDLDTGKVEPFCKDATCNHRGGKCPLNGVDDNLESYNGKVYASGMSSITGGPVQELKDGRFQPITEEGVYRFFHAGGKLYVITADSSLMVYEEGSSKPEMVIEEYTGYFDVVFGDYLYDQFSGGKRRFDLTAENPEGEVLLKGAMGAADGTHMYYQYNLPDADVRSGLYRCNMDGTGEELIVKEDVCAINFDDSYVYYTPFIYLYDDAKDEPLEVTGLEEKYYQIYRFPKDDPSQVEVFAKVDGPNASVYVVPGCDLLFLEVTGPADINGNGTWTYWTIHKDGTGLTKLELPDY